MIEQVRGLIEGPHGEKLILPVDVVVADAFEATAASRLVNVREIPPGGWASISVTTPGRCLPE